MKVIVLSPRVAPGAMSAAAWDAVRSGMPVVAAEENPHVAAIRDAGVEVAIGTPDPSDDIVWVPAPGDVAWAHAWAEQLLDGGLELEIITGSADVPGARLLDLVEVMDRLRRECAWTREQTHESLVPYLIEETQEMLEALQSGDRVHLREELGDLLLQVAFHAAVSPEFDVDDVAGGITEKLIRRNPHVFGESDATTIEEIAEQWERIKSEEKRGLFPSG